MHQFPRRAENPHPASLASFVMNQFYDIRDFVEVGMALYMGLCTRLWTMPQILPWEELDLAPPQFDLHNMAAATNGGQAIATQDAKRQRL